jgi:hypothetical protein
MVMADQDLCVPSPVAFEEGAVSTGRALNAGIVLIQELSAYIGTI